MRLRSNQRPPAQLDLQDPALAGEWVAKQRGAPWYDSAAMGFALAVGARDSAAAEEWANTITNEALREKAKNELAQIKQRQVQQQAKP
jgi:hypothetical protein